MSCFQYGADDITAAVILAVHPIIHAPVVASVVPARAHDFIITNNIVSYYYP